MDSHLIVTPAIFKPGSRIIKGINPPYNPLKRRKHKDKNQRKKQKRGFPIKDFGNDKKGRSSLLIASITLVCHLWMLLSGVQKHLKTKEEAKTWIPTSSSPRQSSSRGPQYLKTLDSRLKISGMTWEGVDASLNFRHDGWCGCPPKFQAW